MKTVKTRIADYGEMKARTMAIARGEYHAAATPAVPFVGAGR